MPLLSPSLQTRLTQPLWVGDVTLHSRVLQSPLSGVTDLVFRRLVRRYAPTAMLYTEMVHAAGVCHVDDPAANHGG
jgi:tRNA-dihydrouridine synthase B